MVYNSRLEYSLERLGSGRAQWPVEAIVPLPHGGFSTRLHPCVGVVVRVRRRLLIRHIQVPRLVLLKREIDILKTVDHPTLIRLEDIYEDDVNLHLVRTSQTLREYCTA